MMRPPRRVVDKLTRETSPTEDLLRFSLRIHAIKWACHGCWCCPGFSGFPLGSWLLLHATEGRETGLGLVCC